MICDSCKKTFNRQMMIEKNKCPHCKAPFKRKKKANVIIHDIETGGK